MSIIKNRKDEKWLKRGVTVWEPSKVSYDAEIQPGVAGWRVFGNWTSRRRWTAGTHRCHVFYPGRRDYWG